MKNLSHKWIILSDSQLNICTHVYVLLASQFQQNFKHIVALNEIKQQRRMLTIYIHASDENDKKQEFHFNRLVHKLD